MDGKKFQDGEAAGCCGRCMQCLMCCDLPASAGVKLVSVFSILFGLVYCCLGVWMIIVTSQNGDLPLKQQLIYENPSASTNEEVTGYDYVSSVSRNNMTLLTTFYSYLIALGVLSLSVGFVRVLSSIFLLWNSVEKHSRTPGKMWIFLIMVGTTSIVTYLLVALNVTGFIRDTPWSPVRVQNDKFSFYILITIFRFICFSDIFLAIYFVFIVLWFVRTR